MPEITIYAPEVSTFGRIVTAVAIEAGLNWTLVPTGAGTPEAAERHPFLKCPAVEIDDLVLYESHAICTYIDGQHNNGALTPTRPEPRARMVQWIDIGAHYVFPILEERLVLPRLVAPLMGRKPNEAMILEALPVITYHIEVVAMRLAAAPYLAGETLSLADVFLYCILRSAYATPEGADMMDAHADMMDWLRRLNARPSLVATAWDVETPL